jgi:hypothetical protein
VPFGLRRLEFGDGALRLLGGGLDVVPGTARDADGAVAAGRGA